MKLLTSNFLTCAVKGCRGHADAYPLQFRDCTLQVTQLAFNPTFLRGIMPRIEWPALLAVCADLGNRSLPESMPSLSPAPTADDHNDDDGGVDGTSRDGEGEEAVLKSLHNVLLETSVLEGKMVCGKCGHVYLIKEGIANMLLAEHEVA